MQKSGTECVGHIETVYSGKGGKKGVRGENREINVLLTSFATCTAGSFPEKSGEQICPPAENRGGS